MDLEGTYVATAGTKATGTGAAGDLARRRSWARAAGRVGMVAGLVGAGVGLVKVLYPPTVNETRYSFPFDVVGFTVENLVLAAQHLGLAILAWGIWRSGAAGRSVPARIGAFGVVVGWVAFAAVKLFAVTARNEPVGSELAQVVDGLSGLAGTLIALFCLVLGVAMVRARIWTTWHRYLPLAAGVLVFVAVLPTIALGSFTGARVAIIVWMVLWAALGWALHRSVEVPTGGV